MSRSTQVSPRTGFWPTLLNLRIAVVTAIAILASAHVAVGRSTTDEMASDEFATRLTAAMEASNASLGAWSARFTEELTTHPDLGDNVARVVRVVRGTVVSAGGRALIEMNGQATTMLVVDHDRVHERVSDELVRRESDSIALFAAPLLVPGVVTLRDLGLPSMTRWHRLEHEDSRFRELFRIETSVTAGNRFSRYEVDFQLDGERRNLRRLSWKAFVINADGVTNPMMDYVMEVESWAQVGGVIVPAVIDRRVEHRTALGVLTAKGGSRTVLTDHVVVDEQHATETIARRARGNIGDQVRDERLGVRYEVGGRWIEIDGRRHALAKPVGESSDAELVELIESIRGDAREGDAPDA